ncbi:hypothetical protein A2U10_01210 [Fusobacterium necrophorum subsp. funduliforme]|uniref:hypothetical protein n=1 Tax=Fusobacterium necrophorum TaxID=859 RepID=UPI0007899709|nr:hypothetical protein [Fusobacterium necrophorum]KYM40968.1 hypothetical protein A2U10_01210 [Fusobacterium necrophorum subsp. funduliforme]KYM44539.1 hypothetical protein A2U08_02400 [Fusobacterium necrophorum subsp. funduliforme]KYM47032.1 hypothetical protein A2U11_04195 [Fusobacterium necrophorum subsp. funduliforme]KYM47227.1 hypothetical protein A2U04_08420 [Fusobacterium necrophorum subsp. funduliforme]KYM49560.1 hypothetical protein A2U06_06095 [Fusobacterium necrophorum subsp. fundu
MSVREEVYKLLALKKNTREIAETLNISIRCAQKHKRTYDDTLANSEQKTNDRGEQKRRKEIAKAHIVTGSSIKEAATQTNTSFDSLKTISSKERLQEKQADFLRRLRDEHKEMILQNKRDRLKINTRMKTDLAVAESSKLTQEMLLMNEKTEQTILESERLDRLERFEFEKEVHKSKLKLEMLEKIEQMSDKELEELQKFLEEKERFVNVE